MGRFQQIAALSALLLAGGVSCDTNEEESESTVSDLKTDDESTTKQYSDKENNVRYNCPTLSDLNATVLEASADDPVRVKHTIDNLCSRWDHKVLAYQIIGNEEAAIQIMTDEFLNGPSAGIEDELPGCFGFEPDEEMYRQRAENLLERGVLASALHIFQDLGDTEKQYEVIDLLKIERDKWSPRSTRQCEIFEAYQKLGDVDNAEAYAKQVFLDAEQNREGAGCWMSDACGYTINPAWYDELGEIHFDEGNLNAAERAFEKSGDTYGIIRVVKKHEENGNVDYALHLAKKTGNQPQIDWLIDKLQEEAITEFIESPWMLSHDSYFGPVQELKRSGIEPTSELYSQRAEHNFEEGRYHGAFEAFELAGDEDGMRKTLEAYTNPARD